MRQLRRKYLQRLVAVLGGTVVAIVGASGTALASSVFLCVPLGRWTAGELGW